MLDSWKKSVLPCQNLEIRFPCPPQKSKNSLILSKSRVLIDCDTFISQPHAEVVYMVLVAHYPSCVDCSNPLSNLQGALHGILLKAPQSQLLTAEFTEVEEYPALDFTTRTPEGYLLGRLIMANNSLYQILTVNASGGDEPDSHESFVRSFGFLCRQPSFQ